MRNNQVLLITGTSRGIGKFLAEKYCEKGINVVGFSRSNATINSDYYTHVVGDILDEGSIKNCFGLIKQKFGQLDVLINNAGVASMNHTLLTPYKTLENIFKTNFYGSFIFSREAAKLMRKKNFGRIINFSTVAVPLNLEGEAVYASSKSAIETLTKIMAKELAPFGITVNCIGPSPIMTDLIKVVPKDKIDELINKQAVKRFAQPDDVYHVINFFIDEKSSLITGQTIYLAGIFK
ncbi:MAG: SDR family oxidoreductase [Cytophagales bacterium]|nr:SDR family oxidoreductase [Bernardetiaceae bacterium]MDW8210550.1 SDR family oxidoreductase [Cytophagales bacterium]